MELPLFSTLGAMAGGIKLAKVEKQLIVLHSGVDLTDRGFIRPDDVLPKLVIIDQGQPPDHGAINREPLVRYDRRDENVKDFARLEGKKGDHTAAFGEHLLKHHQLIANRKADSTSLFSCVIGLAFLLFFDLMIHKANRNQDRGNRTDCLHPA
jgi:hypothetical protein